MPQPVKVGDLIGLPVLDESQSTLGYVREVVRTSAGKIDLIVSYSPWFGWFGRPVAVPIEYVGIFGRNIASLDMSPQDLRASPDLVRRRRAADPSDRDYPHRPDAALMPGYTPRL